MCKIYKFHLLFVLTLCLNSCDYELSKLNIGNLTRPSESHQFDLSIISETDTIDVFQNATFEYNINTYGLDVKSAKFSLNEKEWDVTSTSGSFVILPDEFTPGFYLLSLKIKTNSGTGSIAEHFGTEGYIVEKKWTVYIDNTLPAPIVIAKSISEKGFLKFSWPKCNRVDFVGYKIYGFPSYCNISKTISNRNILSVEDSSYIGGYYEARIDILLKDNRTVRGFMLYLDDPYPILNFESLGIDNLRLYWPKSKYRAKYTLKDTHNIIFQSYNDTSFNVVHPGIGNSVYYVLNLVPTQFDWVDYKYYDSYSRKECVVGNHFLSSGTSRYGYNPVEKVVYANNGTGYEIDCYDVTTMKRKNHLSNTKIVYSGFYSCPNNSTKVAVLALDYIYVFENSNLTNPVMISYSCIGKDISNFTMTDNGLIGISYSSQYDLIRISDKNTIANISITDNIDYLGNKMCSTSNDGKYYNVVTHKGLNLYKIENGIISQIYKDNREYTSTLFNPKNSNELFVSLFNSNIIERRNATDFSLIQTIIMPGNSNKIMNIDSDSDNLLVINSKKCYLIDLATSKISFEMNVGSIGPSCFYQNILFTPNGYYQDISNYIKK